MSEGLSDRPREAMIGVLFDKAGRILSGGECQKLMLVHCFYSGKFVLVMEAPSSALDPAAEQAFDRRMAEKEGVYAQMWRIQHQAFS